MKYAVVVSWNFVGSFLFAGRYNVKAYILDPTQLDLEIEIHKEHMSEQFFNGFIFYFDKGTSSTQQQYFFRQ